MEQQPVRPDSTETATPPSKEQSGAGESLINALTLHLRDQVQLIAAREEAITWLQNELAIARDELRSVKSSKFWKLRDLYFHFRQSLARLRGGWSESSHSLIRSHSIERPSPSLDYLPASVRPTLPSPYADLTIRPTLPSEKYLELESAPAQFPARRPIDIVCFSIIDWSFRYQLKWQVEWVPHRPELLVPL